jgi:hypothetical protein
MSDGNSTKQRCETLSGADTSEPPSTANSSL